MKKLTIILAAVLASASLMAANNGIPGAFVNVGTARASSLGGAYTAVADDASSVFYNPAGIVSSDYKDVTFMYEKQKWMIPYNYFAFIYPFSKTRGVGVGLIVDGDSTLLEQQYILSYCENLDWILRVIKGISLGVNLKFDFASYGGNADVDPGKVTGSAWGMGMDFGFMWNMTGNIQVGAMLRDGLSWIKWDTGSGQPYNEGVPLTSGMAVRYKIKDFLGTAEISDLDMLRLGLEKTLWNYIDIRLGYTQTLDMESYKQYMTGIGIGRFEFGARREFSMNLDVAFLFERLDNTLKIQTSFKFK
jgi:hypothetical protein